MLSEHDMVGVIQCAARRDEETAKRIGGEFYEEYLDTVREMEEDKKNGITGTTYAIPPSYE